PPPRPPGTPYTPTPDQRKQSPLGPPPLLIFLVFYPGGSRFSNNFPVANSPPPPAPATPRPFRDRHGGIGFGCRLGGWTHDRVSRGDRRTCATDSRQRTLGTGQPYPRPRSDLARRLQRRRTPAPPRHAPRPPRLR